VLVLELPIGNSANIVLLGLAVLMLCRRFLALTLRLMIEIYSAVVNQIAFIKVKQIPHMSRRALRLGHAAFGAGSIARPLGAGLWLWVGLRLWAGLRLRRRLLIVSTRFMIELYSAIVKQITSIKVKQTPHVSRRAFRLGRTAFGGSSRTSPLGTGGMVRSGLWRF
jgi:hypothetical protein